MPPIAELQRHEFDGSLARMTEEQSDALFHICYNFLAADRAGA
jgi:hypothetical protein